MEYDWGVIINFKKESEAFSRKKKNPTTAKTKVIVDLLLHVTAEENSEDVIPKPCLEGQVNDNKILLPFIHLLSFKFL